MIFKFSSIFQPENRTGFQEVGNDKNSTKGTEDEIHDPKTLRVCYRKNRDEMEIGNREVLESSNGKELTKKLIH